MKPALLFRLVIRVAIACALLSSPFAESQGAKQTDPQTPTPDSDRDHIKERNEWFYRGRIVRGLPSAELRRKAYRSKVAMRAQRANPLVQPESQLSFSVGSWVPLGPVPLASDASGNGTQDYHQVAGRATAVVVDPADASGNTVFVGGAQAGIWKSTNAAASNANSVVWNPISDDQATLSIGAIAIQPGNNNPANTVILAATGEANNSADSYFGLGLLRSTNGGSSWSLVNSANNGALSFSGLGGTRMAFSASPNQSNTVVSAMATSAEGVIAGAGNSGITPGLYTSLNAGQTWTYNALVDPGGATDATSATSVVYNATAGVFFAAVRYHGLYSSPDGVNWTRLANQPGGAVLSTSACPPQSAANNYACPIYRGEITVVPTRNEMYVWYVYLNAYGDPVDGGIWQSTNGGASWASISDSGITNCGDIEGCGVEQGTYDLALLAVPNGGATDLYAGSINLYKCAISTLNPTCASYPFMNLTHVYGCIPISAPAHVHPDQHGMAYTIPTSGTDSGNALLFFANDGGLYRSLNGFSFGPNSGQCSATNEFEDLNQHLGSMTQFVSFSQHPTDPNTLLGGTQDNGTPATNQATTSSSWGNILGGDGGYTALDPLTTSNFYATNPDIPPGGLGIQLCTGGVNCNNSGFNFVATSNDLGGDDGAFYFPYILDPGSNAAMLVGTCRIWRGPRTGGTFAPLSPNFDTLGSGSCSGSEVNQVRSIAAIGMPDTNGSTILYATTSGLGPIEGPLSSPSGGHVWVTTNASGGMAYFTDVTNNGPQGSINPNQYPISGAAADPTDASGKTAYVTVMGFTGGTGHVWKTTNAGTTWTDFTGNLPDSPANAVVVYPAMAQVFVATDVGVFGSPTSSPNWSELGPAPSSGQTGYLPNVAVTSLSIFQSGTQQLLRASTYGRGIWQFNLLTTPDFQLSISNSPQTISIGQTAVFSGSAAALNGYASSVALSCAFGITAPPATCTPSPSTLTPGRSTPFSVTAGGAAGDYYFNLKGVGSDSKHVTHQVGVVLHIVGNGPDFSLNGPTSPPTVDAGGSTTVSNAVNVQSVNGQFQGAITLTCLVLLANGNPANSSCTTNPTTVTTIPSQVIVTVNAANLGANHGASDGYQFVVQGTSGSIAHTVAVPFNVGDYQLSGQKSLTAPLGGQTTQNLTITASTYYSGQINASCDASSLPGSTCTLNPVNPILINAGATVPVTATIYVPLNASPGNYNINLNSQDTNGIPTHGLTFSLTVQDFQVNSSTTSQTVTAGQTTGTYNLTVQPVGQSFSNVVNLTCSGLPSGAQCLFNPSASVTPGSSGASVGMTIATAQTISAGTYTVTVNGASGALTHSTPVSLVVTGSGTSASPDFQLTVSQAFIASTNNSVTRTAKVSINPNYTGSLNASCDHSAIPASQCVVTPANPVSISANVLVSLTVSLNVPNDAMPDSYNINLTVADESGQPSHFLQLPLTVAQDFSVSSATPSQTVTAGQTTGAYQLTVAPNPSGSSFGGAVQLACSGLPQGANCLFSPSDPQTPGDSAVDVVMTISTAASSTTSRRRSDKLPIFYAMWLLLPAVVLGATCRRKASVFLRPLSLFITTLCLLALLACAGVSTGGGGGGGGTQNPVSYKITVTGTSPGTAADPLQSTVVTLVID